MMITHPPIVTRTRSGLRHSINRRRQHGPTAGQFALVCAGIAIGCALLAIAFKR